MHTNLKIFPVIFALNVAWLWLGIWVPFYLLFTNYAGVGLIETFAYVTGFILELPTGALADLIGKKKTFLLVFAFQILGNIVMATAGGMGHLFWGAFFLGLGATLYSGTRDAFLYDTLLTLKREAEFETQLARYQRYGLLIMAAASAIGGYLYTLSPSLPFWGMAVLHAICLALCFKLVEPPVDSETFSWQSYTKQMKVGFAALFANAKINLLWLWQLLLIGIFAKFLIEGLDPVLLLGFGASEKLLGYLYALVPLVSAGGAYLYEKHHQKLSEQRMWWLVVVVLGGSVVISPAIGLSMGIGCLLLRNLLYPTIDVLLSGVVNRAVSSSHRATALSVASLVQTGPYIVAAAGIGALIDYTSPQLILALLAALFIGTAAVLAFRARSRQVTASASS